MMASAQLNNILSNNGILLNGVLIPRLYYNILASSSFLNNLELFLPLTTHLDDSIV